MKQNQQANTPSFAQTLASASKLHATINTQARSAHHAVSSPWSDQFLKQSAPSTAAPLHHAPPSFGLMPRYPTPFAMAPTVVYPQPAPLQEAAPQNAPDAEDLTAARRMAERLRNEPGFENSEFLRFVDGLGRGDIKFSDNKVVDASGSEVELDDLLDNYESSMDRIWREMASEDPDVFGRTAQSSLYHPPQELDYAFSTRNRYLEDERDLLALANLLTKQGQVGEAVQALESHLRTKDRESAEAWRQLGSVHASRDEDNLAIKCFQKAHTVDPYDSENLLCLGVALTNELDAFRALDTLRLWLKSREEYFALMPGSADYLDVDNLRKDLMGALSKAAQMKDPDADVYAALGVVHNLNKDFSKAAEAFLNACRLKPQDASLWNKLGATLANGGQSEAAVLAYAQALALEPGYVRAWSNLGIANLNMQKPEIAVQCFAQGLKIFPGADNLWSTLFLTCANFLAENEALGQAAVGKNLDDILNLVNPIQAPAPLPVDATVQSIKNNLA